MHLLAHALCGGDDTLLQVGQVAGDFVRGRDLSRFPDRMADGIRHHRALDSFTDQHDAVRRSRHRLAGDWRRYAGVLVDLAYGHFLAQQWHTLGVAELEQFEVAVHDALARHHDALPVRLQRARSQLQQLNVLSGIGDAGGVALACERLSHRLPGLAGGGAAVDRELLGLNADFAVFWPDLITARDALLG